VERAGESQRRGAWAAASLEATRGSYQSRRWCKVLGYFQLKSNREYNLLSSFSFKILV
jgi:hypothetical protein